jgi:hypothetical protein
MPHEFYLQGEFTAMNLYLVQRRRDAENGFFCNIDEQDKQDKNDLPKSCLYLFIDVIFFFASLRRRVFARE